MRFQTQKKLLLLAISITTLAFISCDSNEENPDLQIEPQLIANYYFRGTLDGEVLNIDKQVYDLYYLVEESPYSIDFGGSQTNDNQIEDICSGRYACGIFPYTQYEDDNIYDGAKMYFSDLPVGDCSLENETAAMQTFFDLDSFNYDQFSDYQNVLKNTVALDFFPSDIQGSIEEQNLDYFSSRFGDNTNASFEITSVTEESEGTFLVQGTFSCKLYSFQNNTVYKQLDNGEFRISIHKNLD